MYVKQTGMKHLISEHYNKGQKQKSNKTIQHLYPYLCTIIVNKINQS